MKRERTVNGKKQVYVTPYSWSRAKSGTHPGHWRKKRRKSTKRIISKNTVRLRPIYDEYRQFQGYAPIKKKK